MKKLSDYIIISDVDGTLLPHYKSVPTRNIEALKRFVAKGGRFCIATGRSKELTAEFVGLLPVNAPCVVNNGGALYDFDKREFLMQYFLPEIAKDYLTAIRRDLNVPAMVVSGGDYIHLCDELPFASFSEAHRERFKSIDIESLKTLQWIKVLISVTEKERMELEKYINAGDFRGVRFVHTSETLVEMLPDFSSKGFALEKLVELGYTARENIAAIGDFYNDREMLEFAAVSAVTADAPDDLKAMADFVTGPCELGAVADFVEYLEGITG